MNCQTFSDRSQTEESGKPNTKMMEDTCTLLFVQFCKKIIEKGGSLLHNMHDTFILWVFRLKKGLIQVGECLTRMAS